MPWKVDFERKSNYEHEKFDFDAFNGFDVTKYLDGKVTIGARLKGEWYIAKPSYKLDVEKLKKLIESGNIVELLKDFDKQD